MTDDIRRSQLAGVFGIGSLRITVGGTSMICASLDHWLTPYTKLNTRFKPDSYHDDEWEIDEYRLRQNLGIDYFNNPPQFREQRGFGSALDNSEIVIPYFLFPRYMYCSNNEGSNSCGRLKPFPPTADIEKLEEDGKLVCNECNFKAPVHQVNIITVCDNGHIDDFPWFEWAHIFKKEENCSKNKLVFKQKVVSGIATQQVICGSCNANATLEECFYNMDKRLPDLKCSGNTPWYGPNKKEDCELQPTAIYRSGSTVYNPVIFSSLYIPIGDGNERISELNDLFNTNFQLKNWRIKHSQQLSSIDNEKKEEKIKAWAEMIYLPLVESKGYQLEEIEKVLKVQFFGKDAVSFNEEEVLVKSDQEYKEEEYKVLRKDNDTLLLNTMVQDIKEYSDDIQKYIKNIVLVSNLNETRALVDFTRKNGAFDIEDKNTWKLWEQLPSYGHRWFPAVQNEGEGIFIEFNSKLIDEHSKKENVKKRLQKLEENAQNEEDDSFKGYVPNLDLLFVHTFSHLLINEMAFYSGYNTASIAERLYVKQEQGIDMCGLLIYTAAGDEEGTLGGLVKLGLPEMLDELFEKAMEKARWCSTDPICNEVGTQGPFNKNLGACHSCALLPETSCNTRNSFLDRGVVVGTQNDRDLGLIKTKSFII